MDLEQRQKQRESGDNEREGNALEDSVLPDDISIDHGHAMASCAGSVDISRRAEDSHSLSLSTSLSRPDTAASVCSAVGASSAGGSVLDGLDAASVASITTTTTAALGQLEAKRGQELAEFALLEATQDKDKERGHAGGVDSGVDDAMREAMTKAKAEVEQRETRRREEQVRRRRVQAMRVEG